MPGISSSQAEVDVVQLATGYGLRVRSIRTGEGAIPFPTPD